MNKIRTSEEILRDNLKAWARRRNVDEAAAAEAYRMRDEECFYCGGPGGAIDHLVPQSKGGSGELSNLVPACRSCNSWKRNRDFEYLYSGVPEEHKKQKAREYYLLNREKILRKYHESKCVSN